jgi:hypothetical protein
LVKVTVPVGLVGVVPAGELGVTVAVKVTCWLTAEGLGKDTTLVVVPAGVTISATVPGVPAVKFVSPL